MGTCAGEEFAAISGCVIITSYLFLFIGFYIRVYAKNASKKSAAAASKAAAAAVAESKPLSTGASTSTTTTKSRKI